MTGDLFKSGRLPPYEGVDILGDLYNPSIECFVSVVFIDKVKSAPERLCHEIKLVLKYGVNSNFFHLASKV